MLGMRGTLVGVVSFHVHFWIDTFLSDRLNSPGGKQRSLLNLAHRFTMGACSKTLYLGSSVVPEHKTFATRWKSVRLSPASRAHWD